jgi:hypothetical protein
MNAHLLIDNVQCCEQYVQPTGREEGVFLHSVSIKVTGDSQFNSERL